MFSKKNSLVKKSGFAKKGSFSTKATRPGEEKIQKTIAVAKKKPYTTLIIVASIPLLLLLVFTFKSGMAPTPSSKKMDKILVVKTPTEMADEMTAALQKKDMQTFFELLEKYSKKDINMVNSKGDTLLLVAATLGNKAAVDELLAMGADVNKANAFTKDTPLTRSLYYGTPEISKRLVHSGASLNVKNNYGQSPLFIALEKKQADLIDLFLSSGVEEGLSTDYLFRAVSKQNPLGVIAMLKGGVDGNVANAKGNTPLIIASSLGDVQSVHHLITYRVDLNTANKDGNTALIYAARYNHPEVIQELLIPQTLQVPVDVNWQNNQGQTALWWGASQGFTEVVKRLLAAGADPTIAAKDGTIPYTIAQKNNRGQVLEWFEKPLEEVQTAVVAADNEALLARAKAEGRDISSLTGEGEKEIPLTEKDIFVAIKENDIEKFRKVIDMFGPLVVLNKDDKQMSVFLRAVEKGNKEMADLALENSARIFETSPRGNAFHIAVKERNMDMLKYLVDKTRAEGNLSMMLEYKSVVEGIQIVSKIGVLVPVTPLGVAAFQCDLETYNYLVSIGAKPGVGVNSPSDLLSKCKSKPLQAKELKTEAAQAQKKN